MKEEVLPMFHARRSNFSLMQWVIAVLVIVGLMYSFYAVYDMRRVNEMQREQIAKLTHDEEGLREQMKNIAEEKNKMSKLIENENSRHNNLISSLNSEKAAIEKNCAKDKHDLEVTVKDMTEKNTECKGSLAVAQRDKAKVERDYNDLHDKFAQVNKNLEDANERRAEERSSCNGRIAAMEAKLTAAAANLAVAASHAAPRIEAPVEQPITEPPPNINKPVAVEEKQEMEMETPVHEVKEQIIAQVAPPKNRPLRGEEENERKDQGSMQVEPPRPRESFNEKPVNMNEMQVEPPKMEHGNMPPAQEPLVGHFREADEAAREEA